MNILIIGGTGNISTPITRALIAQDHRVTVYNRGSTPVPGAAQITGSRGDYPRFEEQMAAALADSGGFDCVIDMVAYHPEDVRSVVRAFRGRIGQYIFCSTVDVYVKPAARYPVREDFPLGANPAFTYAYHKVLCEQLLWEAHARGDFPVTSLRPAATYNDTWAPISPIGSSVALLKRIRAGKPLIVLGDGTSFWTSSHRDDVAAAFVNAVGRAETYGRAYHLTGDEWLTWRAYYETAQRVMSAPPVQFVPIPAAALARITHGAASWGEWNFMFNNIFDNSASKADLGYRYTVSWEQGVRRMVAYHDARGAIDSCPEDALYERVIAAYTRAVDQLEIDLA